MKKRGGPYTGLLFWPREVFVFWGLIITIITSATLYLLGLAWYLRPSKRYSK